LLNVRFLDHVKLWYHRLLVLLHVLNLILILYVGLHFAAPHFNTGLCLAEISQPCHLGTLLHRVCHHNIVIGLLFDVFSVARDILLVSDNAEVLSTVESGIRDLSLEWELFDLCKVQIVHFDEDVEWLQCILKRKFRFLRNISQLLHKQSPVLVQIYFLLIPEL